MAGEDNFLVIPAEDRAPDASAKLPSPSIVDIVTCSGACDSVDENRCQYKDIKTCKL